MAIDLQNIFLLFYLLPGFLIYAIVHRLLNIETEKDTFSTTFISLFLSLIVYAALSYLENWGLFDIRRLDWRLTLSTITIIFLLVISSILFIKWILPWLEKKIQFFDSIKYSSLDVFSDVLADRIQKEGKKAVWICVCTKDNLIYSGYVKRQGLLTDNKKAIYVKDVLLLNAQPKDYRIKEFEGMMFIEENVKWIAIVKNPLTNQKNKKGVKNR
ncbi:MAG: DUF6338 family protein [Candidatus Woesearchaeota archaeon]